MDGCSLVRCKNDCRMTVRLEELQKGTEADFMQDRNSRPQDRSSVQVPGNSSASRFWRMLLAASCCWAVVASGWMIVSNCAADASEPDNILLDFSASWCGPCQEMSPLVSKLERLGYPIRKVDVDREPELTRRYNVQSMPTFLLVANGREVTRITGKTDEKNLRHLLSLLPKQDLDNGLRTKPPTQVAIGKSNRKGSADGKLLLGPASSLDDDLRLTPTAPAETMRGQSPDYDLTADGFANDPMAASLRIRVKDGSRVHFGSGTVIDSKAGKSIVLTCGHIFRDLQKDYVVEVDLYPDSKTKTQTLVGKILKFDLDADVGLLSIPTQQPLPICKLGIAKSPAEKDKVMSIGCGGGDRPTRENCNITGINCYNGPDTIECSGLPKQGRSGGGLFLGSDLIGVCIYAEPKRKRGIYTGLKPIAQLLEKANLAHLLPNTAPVDQIALDETPKEASLGSPKSLLVETAIPGEISLAGMIEDATRESGVTIGAASDYAGAEIVCIVRPKTPGAASRVVIVNQASTRFVDDLLHESSGGSRMAPSVKTTARKSSTPKTPAQRAAELAILRAKVNDAGINDRDLPVETSLELRRYRNK